MQQQGLLSTGSHAQVPKITGLTPHMKMQIQMQQQQQHRQIQQIQNTYVPKGDSRVYTNPNSWPVQQTSCDGSDRVGNQINRQPFSNTFQQYQPQAAATSQPIKLIPATAFSLSLETATDELILEKKGADADLTLTDLTLFEQEQHRVPALMRTIEHREINLIDKQMPCTHLNSSAATSNILNAATLTPSHPTLSRGMSIQSQSNPLFGAKRALGETKVEFFSTPLVSTAPAVHYSSESPFVAASGANRYNFLATGSRQTQSVPPVPPLLPERQQSSTTFPKATTALLELLSLSPQPSKRQCFPASTEASMWVSNNKPDPRFPSSDGRGKSTSLEKATMAAMDEAATLSTTTSTQIQYYSQGANMQQSSLQLCGQDIMKSPSPTSMADFSDLLNLADITTREYENRYRNKNDHDSIYSSEHNKFSTFECSPSSFAPVGSWQQPLCSHNACPSQQKGFFDFNEEEVHVSRSETKEFLHRFSFMNDEQRLEDRNQQNQWYDLTKRIEVANPDLHDLFQGQGPATVGVGVGVELKQPKPMILASQGIRVGTRVVRDDGKTGTVSEEKPGGWKVVSYDDGTEQKLRPNEMALRIKVLNEKDDVMAARTNGSSNTGKLRLILKLAPTKSSGSIAGSSSGLSSGSSSGSSRSRPYEKVYTERRRSPAESLLEDPGYSSATSFIPTRFPPQSLPSPRFSAVAQQPSPRFTPGLHTAQLYSLGKKVKVKKTGQLGTVVAEKNGGWRDVLVDQEGTTLTLRPTEMAILDD